MVDYAHAEYPGHPSPHVEPPTPPAEPAPSPILAGTDDDMRAGLLGITEALLKAPGAMLHRLDELGVLFKLSAIVTLAMIVTGLVMASFSGGMQLVWVPLKLAVGVFLCAAICFPSLYIFSSLAGAEQSMRQTFGALLMGVALIGVLLVGFAPVSWVFSQATDSGVFMGTVHVLFLLVASYFGLGLVKRVLAAANGRPLKGTALWSLLFLLVVLQMSTTLRPLIGPAESFGLEPKQFFVAHWLECVL